MRKKGDVEYKLVNMILALMVLLVIGVGIYYGYNWWQSKSGSAREKAGGAIEGAIEQLPFGTSGDSKELAMINQAKDRFAKKEYTEAIDALKKVVQDKQYRKYDGLAWSLLGDYYLVYRNNLKTPSEKQDISTRIMEAYTNAMALQTLDEKTVTQDKRIVFLLGVSETERDALIDVYIKDTNEASELRNAIASRLREIEEAARKRTESLKG